MIYVCCHFPDWPIKYMRRFCRLYAYPCQPEPPPRGGFILLDSGAYGLSKRGLSINATHMEKLNKHYSAYPYAHVYGIAPDVYLNPYKTMNNFAYWHNHYTMPVVPVIQFTHSKHIDLYATLKQVRFYSQYADKLPRFQSKAFIAVSNPALRAIEARDMQHVCKMIREALGEAWLHNLGAGWDAHDIAQWRDMACFDSIDSVAYYSDAKDGKIWAAVGEAQRYDDHWHNIAVRNAYMAQHIAQQGRHD